MSNRDRAWRRRTSRIVAEREQDTQDWLGLQKQTTPKPFSHHKQHRPGKLTQAQDLRLNGQLLSDSADDWIPDPVTDAPEAGVEASQ
jgi:hypothetical protein